MCDAKKKCKKPMKPMKPELEMCSKPKPTGRMFEVIESRKKKPGKKPKPSKKPTKCPSVDDIIAGIAEEMSGKLCGSIEYFSEFDFNYRRDLCLPRTWLD